MAGEKSVKLHNKSDKPDNIILKEHEIVSKCEEIQEQLPDFLKGFFRYLKGDVLSKTRFAYLGDIHFFCRYLIEETDLTEATDPADIKKAEFNKIKASDINEFLDHCREYWVKQNGQDVLYQNGSRTLARKKSSLSDSNITLVIIESESITDKVSFFRHTTVAMIVVWLFLCIHVRRIEVID